MYVVELDKPWLGSPFLFQGFPVTSSKELEQLRDFCEFVYIDLEQSQGVDIANEHHQVGKNKQKRFETGKINISQGAGKSETNINQRNKIKFSQALPQATKNYTSTRKHINTLFNDIRLGKSINVDDALKQTDQMVENIISNENAMVLLTQLKHRDNYTSLHSINVSILSILFGRHMGFNQKELLTLGIGALLHDIGKMQVPLNILNKPGKLNDDEKKIMNSHPQMGYDVLVNSKNFPVEALDIIRFHHERLDGSGYPKRLMNDEIKSYVQIVALVDFYDAVTSDRAYHDRISPHEAINLMYESASKHFSKELLENFINCLGIYPVGSIVELESGEVGVVIAVNLRRKLLPTLSLVLAKDKNALKRPVVYDLAYHERMGKNIKIKKMLKSNDYNIDIRKIIMSNMLEIPDTV